MASFEKTLQIPCPPDFVFAFVQNLANATRWDPRTLEAAQLSEGPIGLGTRFQLRGSVVAKGLRERFSVPDALCALTDLPYEVVEFEAGRRIVFRGHTPGFTYHQAFSLTPAGATTVLRYGATLDLPGLLSLGDAVFEPIFDVIGFEATRDLPSVLASAWLEGRPGLVLPTDVAEILAREADPVLRNLLITQSYHDLSAALLRRTGGAAANPCTLATWASRTAGTFIRNEEVPTTFLAAIEPESTLRRAIVALESAVGVKEADHGGLLSVIRSVVHDASAAMAVGNRELYAELAGATAAFLEVLAGDTEYATAHLAAFQERFRPGAPQGDRLERHADGSWAVAAQGGQDLLRAAFGHLYAAAFEQDPARRDELLLLSVTCVTVHEQTRLQPYLTHLLRAPFQDTVARWADEAAGRSGAGAAAAADAEASTLLRALQRTWTHSATRTLMTLHRSDDVVHLELPSPEAVTAADALLQRVAPTDPPAEASSAPADDPHDWTVLRSRLRILVTALRAQRHDTAIRGQPFSALQRATLLRGAVPEGPL